MALQTDITASQHSTYSNMSDDGAPPITVSTSTCERLHERAPLLLKGTEVSQSPAQAWRTVWRVLRGPQRIWVTVFAALAATLCTLLGGYTLGYPSSALVELANYSNLTNRSSDFDFNSKLMKDLFGAFAPLGGLFGGGMAGWAVDSIGRKPVLILSAVPYIIGWLMLALANLWNSATGFICFILIGRLICGFGLGWGMLSAPIYIGEISPPSLRGLFSAIPQIALAFGVLLVYCIGWIPKVTFDYTAVIAVGITLLFLLLVLWVPETPRYLITKGKKTAAAKSLKFLRGPRVDISGEVYEIELVLLKDRKFESIHDFFQEFRKKSSCISFLLMLFLMALQQLSGINALIFYSVSILTSAGVGDSQFTALLCIGLTEVVATVISSLMVDLFGRKILLVLSAAIMSLSCAALGANFYFTHHDVCTEIANATVAISSTGHSASCPGLTPLAVTSVIGFIVGYSVGMGAIPWILISELFPLRLRGLLAGIVSAVNWACAAIVAGLYFEYVDLVKEWFAWWTFALLNLGAAIFVAFLLPETRGKKLELIEQQLLYDYHPCSWR